MCLDTAVGADMYRSNRTFMELKYSTNMCKHFLCIGSNRTFMELKYASLYDSARNTYVLIAPLWN